MHGGLDGVSWAPQAPKTRAGRAGRVLRPARPAQDGAQIGALRLSTAHNLYKSDMEALKANFNIGVVWGPAEGIVCQKDLLDVGPSVKCAEWLSLRL